MSPDDLLVTPWGALFRGRFMPCAVGRGGIARDKREGDGVTPAGRFALLGVWWRPDRGPRPWAQARAIGPGLGWSDDPDDPLYNRPVPLGRGFGAERMRRADRLYDVVGDMDWNRAAPRPGAGSAIFLHVWRKPRHPTEGCVAFAERDLRRILAGWRPWSLVEIRPGPLAPPRR